MNLETHQSVYRENLLEHLLIGELLKYSWLNHGATLEVSQPSIDRAGHDVVLEAGSITRHIQLKASAHAAKAGAQKVHIALASKPSGCVIWTLFDRETLAIGPFLFFGGSPGQPLPSLAECKVAKHAKANALGEKSLRPNIREVPRTRFEKIDGIAALYERLFGTVS